MNWSDPDFDVMADFRRLWAELPGLPLQPWQEQYIEAVIEGKPLFISPPPRAGRTLAQEAWRKYTSSPGVKGARPRVGVDVARDPRETVMIIDEAFDLEVIATFTADTSPHVDPLLGLCLDRVSAR